LVKSTIFASALLAGAALALPAAAQTYGTDEVTVNPQATTGSQLLLYPGGKYGRLVHPLLQPGQADPNAPLHLHMPIPHREVRHVAKAAPAKPKTQTAAATPPAQQQQSEPPQDMLSFGPVPGESAASMVPAQTPPAKKVASATPKAPPPPPKKVVVAPKPPAPPKQTPPPKKTAVATAAPSSPGLGFLSSEQMGAAVAPPPPPPPAAKPTKTASLEPADTKNMTKRSSIPFSPGAEEPAPEVLDTVKTVSTELNSALSNGSARVELEAFGGKPNDKSSDARRISLKRALIVRQLLIDEGVPSERIDVRAMGGASEGSPDRVDIFVRA